MIYLDTFLFCTYFKNTCFKQVISLNTLHAGKISTDNNLKYISNFSQKWALTFHANCLIRICIKCESMFSSVNKKNIISLSAECAQRVVKVKGLFL